jgi:hypothetical protein
MCFARPTGQRSVANIPPLGKSEVQGAIAPLHFLAVFTRFKP